jgi:hypothetical protein
LSPPWSEDRLGLAKISPYFLEPRSIKNLLQHKLANLFCNISISEESISGTEFQATEAISGLMLYFYTIIQNKKAKCSFHKVTI